MDRINDRELAAAVPAIFLERWTAFADICQNKEREAGLLRTRLFSLFYSMQFSCVAEFIYCSICKTEYLRDLAEVILYFLVPESDFESKALRFLLRV